MNKYIYLLYIHLYKICLHVYSMNKVQNSLLEQVLLKIESFLCHFLFQNFAMTGVFSKAPYLDV